MPLDDMTKSVAAAPVPASSTMRRDARVTWSLRILPRERELEYLQRDLGFWQGADSIGLSFWIICNIAQFRVFNRSQLSTLNWMLNWHTLLLSMLAALQLVAAARVPHWYRRHRFPLMLVMRLSRTATQLIAYWSLTPADVLKLSGCKGAAAAVAPQAARLLVLVPLTQMQQALSCLLPFHVMLPVQLVSAVLYSFIYLPLQLCTIHLVPALPDLVHSWCGSVAQAMNRCVLLLALIPGAAGAPAGCSSSRIQALLLMLLYFMLLLVLFIPVAFAFMRELAHKLRYLREQQCSVVCAWDGWGWVQGLPPRLLVVVVVLLVPWQVALAGSALAVRLLPVDACS